MDVGDFRKATPGIMVVAEVEQNYGSSVFKYELAVNLQQCKEKKDLF